MNKTELEKRTKVFAIAAIRYVSTIPKDYSGFVMGRQLLKTAASIGANYREANRAETQYLLELCAHAQLGKTQDLRDLYRESSELLAIFTSIGRTLKRSNSKFAIRNSQFPS